MTSPPVSIVLPVYNGAKYLAEAIDSVYDQTFRNWELLLIDDGSTDGSPELLQKHAAAGGPQIRYFEHAGHQNRGTLTTRVLGAHLAQSELVALLDQDDVWSPHYLEEHLAHWNRVADTNLGLSYGPGIYWFPDREAEDYVQPLPEGTPTVFQPGELLETFLSSSYTNTPCPSCTLIRREALMQAARFGSAARMSHCEDQCLWWSVAVR